MNHALRLPIDATGREARWQLRLLGDTVLVDRAGQALRLPGRAATALLARLAMAPASAQAREALVELLWPGVALDIGRNRLRQVLSTLKSLLDGPGEGGAVLRADRQSVRLGPGTVACDVVDFETALREGRHGQARALYRGELLPGFYDDWVHDERLRLAALAEQLPAPGRHHEGAGEGARAAGWIATARPAADLAGLAGLSGLAGAGRRAAAVTSLNLPHYLTRLHGADAAGARLRAMAQAHRLVTVLGPGGHGKTRLAVEVAHALVAAPQPIDLLPDDPAATMPRFDLVAFVPLVACTGGDASPDALLDAMLLALRQDARGAPPREHLLALLAGRRSLLLLDNFEQLVDSAAPLLADLLSRCPGLHLLVTSRRALGLDGEHTLVLPPLPLPAPHTADAEAALNPAVALFIDRARAVRADFHLSSRNRAAVLALVHHLQGMPLAIELAASRVRSLSPTVLLDLLRTAGSMAAATPVAGPLGAPDRPTSDRHSDSDGDSAGIGIGAGALTLLSRGGLRAAGDPRHASMLAVVQWSWQLLSPAARQVLPRLSVFAGGFTLAAARAVADAPITSVALALDELVAQSMLRLPPEGDRYELFELIREFAASVLPAADAPGLRARHRRWLTGWFTRLPLSAPLQQVRPELANLAAALLGAEVDGAPEDAAALAAAAQTALSAISLPPPALAALQRCADRLADPIARAVTRAGLARTLLLAGQTAVAERLAQQAIAELPSARARWPAAAAPTTDAHWPASEAPAAAAGGPAAGASAPGLARALVLTRVAHVRWRLHRDPAVAPWLAEALALAEAAAAPALQATILTNQGALLRARDPAASTALQRRAVALWAAAGDVHGVNVGRCNLALALLADRAGAREALALAHAAVLDTLAQGDDMQHALAHNLAGEAWSRLGRWPEAAEAYRACIAAAYTAAEPWPLVYGLWNLPRAVAHQRQPEAAARLMGFAQAHCSNVTGPLTAADHHDLRRVRRLCEQPGEPPRDRPSERPKVRPSGAADVARWWREGAALDMSQAVRLALHGQPGGRV